MKKVKVVTHSAQETMRLGRALARYLNPGSIVCLFGELGSGKTTLVKGIAEGFGISPAKVHSPTFVLMNMYEGRLPLYHFDFYRLEEQAEIQLIGFEEFFYGQGIAVVEWPERLGTLMPEEYLEVDLAHQGEQKRVLTIQPHSVRYEGLMAHLAKEKK